MFSGESEVLVVGESLRDRNALGDGRRLEHQRRGGCRSAGRAAAINHVQFEKLFPNRIRWSNRGNSHDLKWRWSWGTCAHVEPTSLDRQRFARQWLARGKKKKLKKTQEINLRR